MQYSKSPDPNPLFFLGSTNTLAGLTLEGHGLSANKPGYWVFSLFPFHEQGTMGCVVKTT